MRWATRRKIRISRAATAWFIHRFVDPDAVFLFGSDEEVLAHESNGAIGFHCPGSRYPKKDHDGLTPIEALVKEHRPHDAALIRLAAAVREADGPAGLELLPESAGLRLITVALPEVCEDDQAIVRASAIVYDCLYATLTKLTRRTDTADSA
jgi:hypothetical protein